MRRNILTNNKQLQNLVTYGIGQSFNLITPLLVVPHLVLVCGEAGFGKIGIGMALSFLLMVAIDYGSDIVGVKDVSVNRDNEEKLAVILSTAYLSRFVLFLAVIAGMSVVFFTVPFFSREKSLFFMSMPIVAAQVINPTWIFQGIENFKGITIFNITSKTVYLAGVFFFINEPQDYIYANFFWGLGMIISGSAAFLYLKKQYGVSLRYTSASAVSDFIKGNFSMFVSQVFVSLQMYGPLMLIGFLGGDAMAGKYKIVEQVIVVFRTYIFLFFNFAYPRVCYLLETNSRQAMRFWKTYNGLNFVCIMAGMGVLWLCAGWVAAYFNPVSPEEIAGYLRFAAMIPIALSLSIPLKQLLLGWGYQKFYIRFTVGIVLFNLALLAILQPFFGLYGVVASLIIAEAVTILFYTAIVKQRLFRVN